MTTLAVDNVTRDTLAAFETDLILSLRVSLAAHSTTPTAALWAIEDAVAARPGLGLTPAMEECDGSCGRLVWGADPDSRLALCDGCAVEARAAAEEFLVSRLGGHRVPPVVETLRERVAAAEQGDLDPPLVVTRYTRFSPALKDYPADVRLGA